MAGLQCCGLLRANWLERPGHARVLATAAPTRREPGDRRRDVMVVRPPPAAGGDPFASLGVCELPNVSAK